MTGQNIIIFMGKRVDKMSREQLLEAVDILASQLRCAHLVCQQLSQLHHLKDQR